MSLPTHFPDPFHPSYSILAKRFNVMAFKRSNSLALHPSGIMTP